MTPYYSLVVPVYNEAGNIMPLVAEAAAILDARGREFEVLLVNDGSTDGTAAEIAAVIQRWPNCAEIRMPGRCGQGAALFEGLRAARGEVVLTMDGDGQNDPRDFPALINLVESGQLDVACGWRVGRRDTRLRRVLSRIANAIRRRLFGDHVHDAGCQLRVMRSAVCQAMFPASMMQSFLPAIAVAANFRVGELPVNHRPRRHGRTKYPLGQLLGPPLIATMQLWVRLRMGRRQ